MRRNTTRKGETTRFARAARLNPAGIGHGWVSYLGGRGEKAAVERYEEDESGGIKMTPGE